MQSEGIIIKTEYVRFAKIGGFFKNFGRFFVKLIKKSSKHIIYRCLEGESPFQSPIVAKLLKASGKTASHYIQSDNTINICNGHRIYSYI